MSETPKPPSLRHQFSGDDEHAAAQYGWILGWAACAEAVHNALYRRSELTPKPSSGRKSAEPCKGFQYIGQPLSSCDNCGYPYWEHSHIQTLKDSASIVSPFSDDTWDYQEITEEGKTNVREAYLGS